MHSEPAIGGYLELELGRGSGFPYADATLLNSARSCLQYILNSTRPAKLHIPRYLCGVVVDTMEKVHVPYEFYSIDDDLRIVGAIDLRMDEFILYVNYFGVMDKYCHELTESFGNQLIMDCSQAFFFEPKKARHAFYSPRKFFGVPDGGCLVGDAAGALPLDEGHSAAWVSHLVKRIDESPESGYADFLENERRLDEAPMQRMSMLTRRILDSIDYGQAMRARRRNFALLHERLGPSNDLALSESESECPMVYPYRTKRRDLRARLLARRIFTPTYWPDVRRWCSPDDREVLIADEIVPLPIDQRYGAREMDEIVRSIG